MSNGDEQANSTMRNQSSGNSNAQKKTSFWQRVNDTMNAINSAIGTGKSIHEKLGSPLGILKDNIWGKSKETENISHGDKENCTEKKVNQNASQENKCRVDENTVKGVNTLEKEIYKENVPEKNKKEDKNESALELFENQLKVCSENPEYSVAIKNLIGAELGAFKLLKSPNSLLLQNFNDLVMEHLLDSYKNIDDEQEKENFQKNAGLLIRSVINYLQARIAFLEDEETGVQDLVDSAAEDIGSFSYFILGEIASNESKIDVNGLAVSRSGGDVGRISIQPKFNQQSVKNACDELRKIKSFGILARMFFAGRKIQREKEIFYSFLVELFECLRKYRSVFGENNRILAQLIERYGKIIAEEFYFSEDVVKNGLNKLIEKQPSIADEISKFPREPSVGRVAVISFVITFVIDFILIYAIRNFSYFILLTILIVIISIAVFVFILNFVSEEYSNSYTQKDWQEKVNAWWTETANVYYKALAKSFYDFDKL